MKLTAFLVCVNSAAFQTLIIGAIIYICSSWNEDGKFWENSDKGTANSYNQTISINCFICCAFLDIIQNNCWDFLYVTFLSVNGCSSTLIFINNNKFFGNVQLQLELVLEGSGRVSQSDHVTCPEAYEKQFTLLVHYFLF